MHEVDKLYVSFHHNLEANSQIWRTRKALPNKVNTRHPLRVPIGVLTTVKCELKQHHCWWSEPLCFKYCRVPGANEWRSTNTSACADTVGDSLWTFERYTIWGRKRGLEIKIANKWSVCASEYVSINCYEYELKCKFVVSLIEGIATGTNQRLSHERAHLIQTNKTQYGVDEIGCMFLDQPDQVGAHHASLNLTQLFLSLTRHYW